MIFAISACSQSDEPAVPTAPKIDLVLPLTEISKYYYAGDVVATPVIYSPSGIDMGAITINKKVTKTIQLKNSSLLADFPTSIRLEENNPKVFSIDSNNCSIIKTGQSCEITISAYFNQALFTSTKTARLVIGKSENPTVDLATEIFGQVQHQNIISSQYTSDYQVAINKSFDTDYSQFIIQERVITVSNTNSSRFLRNDFMIPELIGSNPTYFHIISNQCLYPVMPLTSCEIRVLYKRWKTTATVPDTEIRLPNQSANFSLKYGQLVTYTPVYGAWSTCSASAVCSGSGTRNRLIVDCIKNSQVSSSISNCSGTTTEVCQSPAGNQTVPIVGGSLYQSCGAGAITWVDQSVTCNEDFHEGSLNCIPDVFVATFTPYSPSSNPLTEVCSGEVIGSRSVNSCTRQHNAEAVSLSKCIDPAPTITYRSPSGTRTNTISNGIQSQSCSEGSVVWVTTNVVCDEDFHRVGDTCSPTVYIPTYSEYNTSPVESTVCAGPDTVSRTITQCRAQHNNQLVNLSKCSDPAPTKVVNSPAGTQIIDLIDPNTGGVSGTQNQACALGSTVWNPINTNCYTYYNRVGNSCEANNLSQPTSLLTGNVYSQNSGYIFTINTDNNATDLRIYSNDTCSAQIGTGTPLSTVWSVTGTFTPNVLTTVYARSFNNVTLRQSNCNALFNFMLDTQAPVGSLTLNGGASSTTQENLSLQFSGVSDNSGQIQSIVIYENSTCVGSGVEVLYQNPYQYQPQNVGPLSIGVEIKDSAGNYSACVTDDIYYGLEVQPLYSVAPNWNDYYLVSSGTPGQACTGAESNVTKSCIHGGEKKIVRLDQTSCSGLSLEDSLGLFDWACRIESGRAVFESKRIKNNAGLNLLINQTNLTWRPNSVSLTSNGSPLTSSPGVAWYSNPLVELNSLLSINPAPAGITSLTSSGTIYVLKKTNPESDDIELFNTTGVRISSNKVALVTMPGAILKNNGTSSNANNCNSLTGLAASADRNCLLSAGNGSKLSFLYIEGHFYGPTVNPLDIESGIVATNNPIGILLSQSVDFSIMNLIEASNSSIGLVSRSKQSTVMNVLSHNNLSHGIELSSATNNLLYNINSVSNQDSGIKLTNSNLNTIVEAYVYNSGINGIHLDTSPQNKITNSNSSNNGSKTPFTHSNLRLDSSDQNSITMSQFSSAYSGIYLSSSKNNIFVSNNTFNNSNGAYDIYQSKSNIAHNLLALNNRTKGVNLNQASGQNYLSQLTVAMTGNTAGANSGVYFNGIGGQNTNNKFEGQVWLQDQAVHCAAENTGANSYGMTLPSCAQSGLSSYEKITNVDPIALGATFVGLQRAFLFEDTYRIFGGDTFDNVVKFSNKNSRHGMGKDFIDFDQSFNGRCGVGETCSVFDSSLTATDATFRGRLDNINQISVFTITSGQACPAIAAGTNFLSNGACVIANTWNTTYKSKASCESNGGTWAGLDSDLTVPSMTSAKFFLKNAVEINDPTSPGYSTTGNHNGLCESGESCLFTANLGSYQGHGDLSSCNFSSLGGEVSNVSIWGFSSNGY